MAIKFEKVKAGDILLDIHRCKMGNTTMSEWGLWKVKIISIDHAKGEAMVSWNHNAPEKWSRKRVEKLYVKEPKAYRDQMERRRKSGSSFF